MSVAFSRKKFPFKIITRAHICTDSRRFQNTARQFTKFPRTRAAPPFVVIVVEKECCAKILSTVNRYIHADTYLQAYFHTFPFSWIYISNLSVAYKALAS